MFNVKDPVLLVDCSSYLGRAYYLNVPMENAAGELVNALYNMLVMLKDSLAVSKAKTVVCVFDGDGQTHRHQLYSNYKKSAPALCKDLLKAIPKIEEAFILHGHSVLRAPGIESDDVIGTLAKSYEALGHTVVISAMGKQYAQLVSMRTRVYNPSTREMLDIDGLIEKYGVEPERIVDYLTLLGTPHNEVEGAAKLRRRRVLAYLAEYGTLERIVYYVKKNGWSVESTLRRIADTAEVKRALTVIRSDCDLSSVIHDWPSLDELSSRPIVTKSLEAFYTVNRPTSAPVQRHVWAERANAALKARAAAMEDLEPV